MKIKLINILALLLVPFLTGCIHDDLTDCVPTGNVTVLFRYPDAEGADRFMEMHESVVIAVFDENNQRVHVRSIGKSALESFQGDKFNLPAGSYRIVCWGNVLGRSQLSPLTKKGVLFEESYLTLETSNPKQSSDPVMYAPRAAAFSRGLEAGDVFRLIVSADGEEVEETIDFFCAHTEIRVYAHGLSTIAGEGDTAPNVTITELPSGYDFKMNVRGGTEGYTKTTAFIGTANGPQARAQFYTGNFEENDPVTVKLISGVDGSLLAEVYLPEYLQEKQIDFSELLERVITVVFEFREGKDVGVTVSFSGWKGEDTTPEVDITK